MELISDSLLQPAVIERWMLLNFQTTVLPNTGECLFIISNPNYIQAPLVDLQRSTELGGARCVQSTHDIRWKEARLLQSRAFWCNKCKHFSCWLALDILIRPPLFKVESWRTTSFCIHVVYSWDWYAEICSYNGKSTPSSRNH